MHELRIAEDLAVIVLEAARKDHLEKVTKVNIAFGRMVQIAPDIFESAFRETVKNTPAHDSEIDIEIVPVRLCCRTCSEKFMLRENHFSCDRCGGTDIELITGMELFIKSIEGE